MNQENLKDKRIAVVGAGGVGGYLGAMLARTYGHVTLVVRGRRMESIRENGLVLHSDYKGEIAARPERAVPIDQMGEQDIIFVCVKNYSLEEACRDIQDFVTEDTIIVPVDVYKRQDPGSDGLHKQQFSDAVYLLLNLHLCGMGHQTAVDHRGNGGQRAHLRAQEALRVYDPVCDAGDHGRAVLTVGGCV